MAPAATNISTLSELVGYLGSYEFFSCPQKHGAGAGGQECSSFMAQCFMTPC